MVAFVNENEKRKKRKSEEAEERKPFWRKEKQE